MLNSPLYPLSAAYNPATGKVDLSFSVGLLEIVTPIDRETYERRMEQYPQIYPDWAIKLKI